MKRFAVLFVVFLAVFGQTEADCPTIITREQWAARPATSPIPVLPIQPAPFYVVHHSSGATCVTEAACSQQMRNIQDLHIDGNGWADIGYSFMIGGDGLVYAGRGWGYQGVHAPGYDNQSVGVGFFGTFMGILPTAAALNAGHLLIECGIELGYISPDYWIIGHSQTEPVLCPGTALMNNIQTWPRFNANPSPVT